MTRTFLILIFLSPVYIYSQEFINLRDKTIDFSDTVKLDTLSIIPQSVFVRVGETELSDSLYVVDYKQSILIFKDTVYGDLTVSYRVLDYDFSKSLYNKDTVLIVPRLSGNSSVRYNPLQQAEYVLSRSNLSKKGVIMRGISVGNNQDPVINSKFNLQLAGKLTHNLNVEAVISDETMPIQPDGNTAQIQDFNKIFIRVFNKNMSLIAGDFEVVSSKDNYFLNYNKQLKGLMFVYKDLEIGNKLRLRETASGVAVAKGKYRRQVLVAVEGNQGPYKLQGNNSETFIMIVAGSERVYIDGELLVRGERNDYAIDYNAAELTFTPKQMITKDKRIIVEFEYSERNYTRFTVFSNNKFNIGKNEFFFNVYSEADARNQTIDMELNDEMKSLLTEVGDSLHLAKFQNVDSVGYDEKMILYAKIDTVIDGNKLTFYRYSTNPDLAHYQLSFSYTGNNLGNYKIDVSQTNGRVYRWVAPVNGKPQGDYEAVTTLVSPQKKQMLDCGGKIFIDSKRYLQIETAVSNVDMNLFSDNNDTDNIGEAVKLNFVNYFSGNDTTLIKSKFWTKYEYTNKNFVPVEKYKTPEFERDWNLNNSMFADEHLSQVGYTYVFEKGKFSTDISALLHRREYSGINSNINFIYAGNKYNLLLNNDLLFSKDKFNKSKFIRSKFGVSRRVSVVSVGLLYAQETNYMTEIKSDSLSANSVMFHSLSFYVQSDDSSKFPFKAEYCRRWNFGAVANNYKNITNSNDFNLETTFKRKNYNLNFVASYRQLQVVDTANSHYQPENSLTTRFSANIFLFNKALNFSSVFLLSGGLEQKMQYVYVEVEPSKGVYMWVDYNKDNVKQVDEFEIATYSDQANYVRVALQSNEYIKVYAKKFTQSVLLNLSKFFRDGTKINLLAQKLTNTFTLSLDHKAYNFNLFSFSDDNVVSFSNLFTNNLSLRLSEKTHFNYLLQQSKSILTMVNGQKNSNILSNKFILKYYFTSNIILSDEYSVGSHKDESKFSTDRNFLINKKNNLVGLMYTTDELDLSLKYGYAETKNINGDEKLYSHNLLLSGAGVLKKNRLSIELNVVKNLFRGDFSTAVGYSMLEGLKPDLNFIWTINFKRKIGKFLQLTVLYSGRYATDSKIINTGSVNIAAYF